MLSQRRVRERAEARAATRRAERDERIATGNAGSRERMAERVAVKRQRVFDGMTFEPADGQGAELDADRTPAGFIRTRIGLQRRPVEPAEDGAEPQNGAIARPLPDRATPDSTKPPRTRVQR